MTYAEATMSPYIKGFDAGYNYVLTEIEKNKHMNVEELLAHLKGEVKNTPEEESGIAQS
jgi:hypothetical protein